MARDEPLAFFLTWTTYGTWLPGDERGWVAKPGVFRLPDPELQQSARRLMTEPELILDQEQRRIVEQTIADHCRIRHWHLHVVNARTKHIHVVVTASGRTPSFHGCWLRPALLTQRRRSFPSTSASIS